MPEKIPQAIKHKAIGLVTEGQNRSQVAASLGISDRTIRRARQKVREHGDIEGGTKKAGPKHKLLPEMELVFLHYLA